MSDVLTIDDFKHAVEVLSRAHVLPAADGTYAFHVSPREVENIHMWARCSALNLAWREQITALSILDHERRRRDLGRRATEPTADEALLKALRLERDQLRTALAAYGS